MIKRFSYFILILIISACAVFAQDLDEVTISGKISDTNNAPIVGATVAAKLIATGAERTAVTDSEGRFKFIELKPGNYTVKVSMTGFGAQEQTDLVTVSGQNVQLTFTLAPAGVKVEQTVTIGGDNAPVVDTSRTIVGGTITEREITEIPTNSRNPLDLVLTLGGTSEEALSTRDLSDDRNVTNSTAPAEQGNFSLSGGVSYSNNITIDGLDNNDDRSANVRFQPSLESIDEVQVITNQFSAEYGRASGGRINLRTRSGTNKFRGRVFMFFRDDNLNSNTWYNNSRGFARLPLTEYNPGFTLSGPVVLPKIYDGRNKTFFSVAYEYLNVQDTTFINTWVPVGANPNYPLPTANGTCPSTVPTPPGCVDTNSTGTVGILPYTSLFATPNVNHIFTAKFDQVINAKNNFTIGYQMGRSNNQRTRAASTTRLDDALQARKSTTDAINFTDNHFFTARLVNQFRFQYSIFEPRYETDTPFEPVVLIGYRNPEANANQTLIVGNSTATGGNSETFPQNRRETRYQFQNTLTYVFGNQTMKFGGDFQYIRSRATELTDATGTFNFANIGQFQSNTLSRFRLNFGTGSDVKNTYYGFFINDEIKLRENLTLNLGLRYERETTVDDNNNFGPRFGIAWDPFKKGNTVIRFGGGIFYNRTLLRTVADSIQNVNGIVAFDTNSISTVGDVNRRNGILAAIAQRFPNSFASEAELRTLVTTACATIVTTFTCNSNTGFIVNSGRDGNPLRSVDADLKIPESYQFNVGFEREIGNGWVFEANYTWNKTVRLWRDRNINAPVLPTGVPDWATFLENNFFQLSPTRQYRFYRGSRTDTIGLGTAEVMQGNSNTCSTTTPICYVNLNTVNSGTATPLVSVPGSNNNATGSPIGIALAAIARFRPDINFEEKSRIGSIGKAFYQGLILEVRSRYRKWGVGFGGSMRFNYTLSSTKDDGLNNTANGQVNGDFDTEYTRTIQDRRHRIAFSGIFDTPYWFGKLRFSPLFRAGSSAPFSIGVGGSDRNLDDVGTDRPNFNGDVSNIVWTPPGSPFAQSLFDQFALPTIGSRGGNLPRNAGTGPGFFTFDLSVSREFKLTETMKLRPVIQFDNILNAAVFNFGAGFIDFNGTNFVTPQRTFRQRQIRLGLRFDF